MFYFVVPTDWSHIHAIAMSAEAERRLQEDLRFLESVNVWHLVNLRSPNPHAMYAHTQYHPDRLDVVSPTISQLGGYSNSYNQMTSPSYLDAPKYSSLVGNSLHSSNGMVTPPISAGVGTSLPYPDLIIHAQVKDVPPPRKNPPRFVEPSVAPEIQYEDLEILPKFSDIIESREFSPVIQPQLHLKETSRLKQLSLLPKEADEYDIDNSSNPDAKKSVSFTADTVFIERDMNSPFWKAFTERRRLRRLHRQKKQMNAQMASVTYQPSLLELVKSAFTRSSSRDSNGNCTKRKSHTKKPEVLVYENSSQIPESYTAQYVYSVPQTRPQNKLLQMISCQCCSSTTTV